MHTERVDKLLAVLRERGVRGALIHKSSNMRYLSGYTGEGLLVVGEGVRAIVTDFRYTEQAEKQAPSFSVHMTSTGRSHDQIAAELLGDVNPVAFEDDAITVRAMAALREAFGDKEFVPMNGAVEALREVKDLEEIACIEKACQISCAAFEDILGFIRPGVTELEVRFELENAMYRHGAENLAFSTIVASGENGSLPHAIPGTRVLKAGEMITLDYGARYGGYCADITRTVALGKLDADKMRVYETVLEAQMKALEAIRPGVKCSDVDAVARNLIDERGYQGRFGHGLGHSVGLDIHESPNFNGRCGALLRENIVITNEPGIYLPGNCGCRIEDTVAVTSNGCRRLTTATKELINL